MTDLPVPPQFPPPPGDPSVPPGVPAGAPSIWQAAIIVLALGVVAGGSCAAFLQHPNGAASGLYSVVFFLSLFPAAAAFVLLGFRLWRRRQREAWPSVGQTVLIAVAGVILAGGGCGGWALTIGAASEFSALIAVSVALFVLFVIGVVMAVGAGELFVVSIFRLIFKRPGAR